MKGSTSNVSLIIAMKSDNNSTCDILESLLFVLNKELKDWIEALENDSRIELKEEAFPQITSKFKMEIALVTACIDGMKGVNK